MSNEQLLQKMKDELMRKPRAEIDEMAKDVGIPRYIGKNKKTKEILVDEIVKKADELGEVEKRKTDELAEIFDEPVELNDVAEEEIIEWDLKDRTKYIEEAEVGTLVAFYDEKGKPRTGALVNRSSTRKVVKIVTEYNWEFIIPYENVLWVRKGPRWPRPVYKILKERKYAKIETE